jgi:hypothetical protein
MEAHRPQGYPGKVTLFRVQTTPFFYAHMPDLGWGEHAAGGVEIRMVPGANYNILEKPHVVELAKQLNKVLEAADAGGSGD